MSSPEHRKEGKDHSGKQSEEEIELSLRDSERDLSPPKPSSDRRRSTRLAGHSPGRDGESGKRAEKEPKEEGQNTQQGVIILFSKNFPILQQASLCYF